MPLKEPVVNEDRPIADFSSYAAIWETYKKVAVCVDDFRVVAWQGDAYDELFIYPDDRSFEYYIRLLLAANYGSRYMGYDEIDLNGDGQDELVLLGEDYRIKAIFTPKDGEAILLDLFSWKTAGWTARVLFAQKGAPAVTSWNIECMSLQKRANTA